MAKKICEHVWVMMRARGGYCMIQCVRCGWHTGGCADEEAAGDEWSEREREWK